MSDDDIVLTDVEDNVGTVTINRPNRRNALSNATVEALIEAFDDFSEDDDVHVVVLTGAGDKAFCAGGDVGDQQAGGGMLEMHNERGRFADLLVTMNESAAPIVARVNGHALGGGLGLVLNSDVAVAAEGADLGTPELKLGLFPMMILAVIQRNLPRKRAMEMVLTGEKYEATEAEAFGMINYAVAPDELDAKVEEMTDKIGGYSSAILELGRRAFYQTQDMSFEEALNTLHKDLTINTFTEDMGEGMAAFFSDRDPDWSGK